MYKSLTIIMNNVTAAKVTKVNEVFNIENKTANLPNALRSKETLEIVKDIISVNSVIMDYTGLFVFHTSSANTDFNPTVQLNLLAENELFSDNEIIVQTFENRQILRTFALSGGEFKEI